MSESANPSTDSSIPAVSYTPEPNDVLRDNRTDELIRIVYLDAHVAVCRVDQQSQRGSGEQWIHRMDTRSAFDAQLDNDRLTPEPDAEIDAPPSTQPTVEKTIDTGDTAGETPTESDTDTDTPAVDESTVRINETDWGKYASEPSSASDTETETDTDAETSTTETDAREPWSDVDHIGAATEANLYDAGFETAEDIRQADNDELLAVDQLGSAGIENLRESINTESSG